MRSENQRGGARNGAGRKTRQVEEDVKGAIKAALNANPGALEAIWNKVITRAKEGSDKHAQIFFNYYYGKPKENLEQPQEMIINVVRKH